MTQKTIKNFVDDFYSKPPENNYGTNKTDVYHINDIWILDILDLEDYGPQINGENRCVLVAIDSFGKFG